MPDRSIDATPRDLKEDAMVATWETSRRRFRPAASAPGHEGTVTKSIVRSTRLATVHADRMNSGRVAQPAGWLVTLAAPALCRVKSGREPE